MPQAGQHTLGKQLQWPLAALLLLLCLVLGGGQGTIGDALCQALAAGLILLTLWRSETEAEATLPRVAWLALLPPAVPLLQLLPIPEALWSMPGARVEIEDQLAVAGLEPAMRWTLTPFDTETALIWLLPAAALFLATLQLDNTQRLRLVAVLVSVTVIAVILGLAQLAAGPDSGLYFYRLTNDTSAVGFAANRNHFASQLALTLPFALLGTAAWWNTRRDDGRPTMLLILAGVGLAVLLILALALVRSRAGLALGMFAIALSVPAILSIGRQRGTRRLLAAAVATGLLLSVQFALFGVLQRFDREPMADARFEYAQLSLRVAQDHAPLGAGVGGFRRAFEAYDIDAPVSAFVNHAHNDYAELWLDSAWLGLASGLGLVGAFLVAASRAWRRRDATAHEKLLGLGASIGLAALALHSSADYPLRTSALLACAGLMAALMSRPQNIPDQSIPRPC